MKLVSKETLLPSDKKYVFVRLFLFEADYKPRYISEVNTLSGRNELNLNVKEENNMLTIKSLPYFLQNGTIKNKHIFYDIESFNTESAYLDINTKFTVKLPYDKDKLKFIKKGVRGVIKVNRYKDEKEKQELLKKDSSPTLILEEAEEAVSGYLDNYTLEKNDLITLDFISAGSLLNKKCDFEVKGMKRSFMLSELLFEAGLNAVIDFTGLPDDIIDYTTRNSSEAKEMKGEGLTGGDDTKTTYSLCVRHGFPFSKCYAGKNNFDKDFKPFANPKRKYYQKARELGDVNSIFKWFRANYRWKDYPDNHHSNPDVTLENIRSNCADSNRLLAGMLQSINIPTVLLHGSPYGRGHYFCSAKIKDMWHIVDTCYWSRRGEHSTNTYGH